MESKEELETVVNSGLSLRLGEMEVHVLSVSWAAQIGAELTSITREYGEDVAGASPSRIRERYLVGPPQDFDPERFKTNPDVSQNIFYLSNCFHEMSAWENRTTDPETIAFIEQVASAVEAVNQ